MRVNLDEGEQIEVQMAPLIDCVFLLLIFFLVATTLKEMHPEVAITLPSSDAAVEIETDPQTLVLGVSKYGKLYVNGQDATITTVFEQVRLAKQEGRMVRLDADQDTPFRRVLELLEICHVEGLKNVGVHTREEDKIK